MAVDKKSTKTKEQIMKKIYTLLLSCVLTVIMLFSGGVALAQGDYACSCTGFACGNNAIGGDQGDIFDNLSANTVETLFTTNPNTGWTCVIPAAIRGSGGPEGCYCEGYCGNGGIGADPNFFDLGLSQETVANLYGGGQPGNRTGWLCGSYRGSI
ncbi:MAG: hypothetical protein F6K63_15635 [Moorea sp. SIO1G6]|uniref:hypothetical protein n=1 Tax=Moorena sp. SIO1G6 TaxID=2607840 RepID=UPI0013C014EE|nr:hypothetical protein [Moorena sp. SIO1G6]NET65740.1 hypothetical protein [Moorena sp. SIO1G6]